MNLSLPYRSMTGLSGASVDLLFGPTGPEIKRPLKRAQSLSQGLRATIATMHCCADDAVMQLMQ